MATILKGSLVRRLVGNWSLKASNIKAKCMAEPSENNGSTKKLYGYLYLRFITGSDIRIHNTNFVFC